MLLAGAGVLIVLLGLFVTKRALRDSAPAKVGRIVRTVFNRRK